jgi:hypothetical protein
VTSSYPAAPPPPPERGAGRRDAFRLGAAALALTVLASAVGALGWAAPERTPSGWQIADVPGDLLALVVISGIACLAVAALLARPWSWRAPVAAVVWWALGLATVLALVWNDLYVAALGTADDGPVIPVFDWMFTFVPALVAALVTRRRGRPAQLRAGLGTAVVSLPMVALGWALYSAPDGFVAGLGDGLYTAAVFGVVPLVIALASTVRTDRRTTPVG